MDLRRIVEPQPIVHARCHRVPINQHLIVDIRPGRRRLVESVIGQRARVHIGGDLRVDSADRHHCVRAWHEHEAVDLSLAADHVERDLTVGVGLADRGDRDARRRRGDRDRNPCPHRNAAGIDLRHRSRRVALVEIEVGRQRNRPQRGLGGEHGAVALAQAQIGIGGDLRSGGIELERDQPRCTFVGGFVVIGVGQTAERGEILAVGIERDHVDRPEILLGQRLIDFADAVAQIERQRVAVDPREGRAERGRPFARQQGAVARLVDRLARAPQPDHADHIAARRIRLETAAA